MKKMILNNQIKAKTQMKTIKFQSHKEKKKNFNQIPNKRLMGLPPLRGLEMVAQKFREERP